MLERGFSIAKINWKYNLLPHFLVAALLCIVSPLLMGVENLDEKQVAAIIEVYLSFLGIILLVPLFLPDTNREIRDLTASKNTPLLPVRLIRLVEAVILLAALLIAYLLFLKRGSCQFRFGVCFYAAFATCLFQGGLGVLFFSVIDNIVFAYMIPFLYFILCMGGASKLLGKFSLFGLRMELAVGGTGTGGKIYLLGAGMLMLTAGLIIRKVTRR